MEFDSPACSSSLDRRSYKAPKAPAGTTPKPADGKKEPEAPKAPADTSAKPADGKKEPEAPKAPADPLTYGLGLNIRHGHGATIVVRGR